jgi:Siphovirus-type tail component, C-terminal domain
VLTRVNCQNGSGGTLSLPLSDTSGGYVLRDIEGLDPVTATITSQSNAQTDGVQIQSARRDSRNITMKIGFKPDYVNTSVKSLRSNLYDYFLPKSIVGISFFDDEVLDSVTSGTVESFSNSLFTADPEVDLSIICPDPDFYAPTPELIYGGSVTDTTSFDIPYTGTSDAGVIFTLEVNQTLTGFTLYNMTPDGSTQVFDVENVFTSGDIVVVNSVPGSRGVTLNRAGLVSSILYSVNALSENWITLKKGANQFRCHSGSSGVPYTVSYTAKYAGILTET